MFAIVAISGKQYAVEPGAIVVADHILGDVGSSMRFDAMLVSDDKKIMIGDPTVPGAAVVAKIVAQEKGEKIDVRRYKSKVRYRKARGFRARLTRFEIVSIEKS